jgi:hypothetical protein
MGDRPRSHRQSRLESSLGSFPALCTPNSPVPPDGTRNPIRRPSRKGREILSRTVPSPPDNHRRTSLHQRHSRNFASNAHPGIAQKGRGNRFHTPRWDRACRLRTDPCLPNTDNSGYTHSRWGSESRDRTALPGLYLTDHRRTTRGRSRGRTGTDHKSADQGRESEGHTVPFLTGNHRRTETCPPDSSTDWDCTASHPSRGNQHRTAR